MRGVDLVQDGPYLNLMYRDDMWYRDFVPVAHRGRTLYDLAAFIPPRSAPRDPADYYESCDVAAEPYEFLIAHYARYLPPFAVCDIGAHYGGTSMDTAQLLRALGASARMFAFDPGRASELTWRNFENNGFADIEFTRAAVGPIDGHVVMHFGDGHAEDNRLVNPNEESVSEPVRCVRLDSFLEGRGAFGPACLKIDTQGAEPGVFQGAQRLLAEHPVAILTEFTPWAIRASGHDPVAFLQGLMASHVIYDVGASRDRLNRVDSAQDVSALDADVGARHTPWTDVLLVPRQLPELERALLRLDAAGAALRAGGSA